MSDRNLRKLCPKVTEIIGRFDEFLARDPERLHQCVIGAQKQFRKAERLQQLHNEKRRAWQERIQQDPRLRNQHQPITGCKWIAIPYWSPEREKQVNELIIKHNISTATWTSSQIDVWWPEQLLADKIAPAQRFYLPPPLPYNRENVGRDFSTEERVLGAVCVHDAHPDFPALMPIDLRDWATYQHQTWFIPNQVDDSWSEPLGALFRRIERDWHAHNAHREKFSSEKPFPNSKVKKLHELVCKSTDDKPKFRALAREITREAVDNCPEATKLCTNYRKWKGPKNPDVSPAPEAH